MKRYKSRLNHIKPYQTHIKKPFGLANHFSPPKQDVLSNLPDPWALAVLDVGEVQVVPLAFGDGFWRPKCGGFTWENWGFRQEN